MSDSDQDNNLTPEQLKVQQLLKKQKKLLLNADGVPVKTPTLDELKAAYEANKPLSDKPNTDGKEFLAENSKG